MISRYERISQLMNSLKDVVRVEGSTDWSSDYVVTGVGSSEGTWHGVHLGCGKH